MGTTPTRATMGTIVSMGAMGTMGTMSTMGSLGVMGSIYLENYVSIYVLWDGWNQHEDVSIIPNQKYHWFQMCHVQSVG